MIIMNHPDPIDARRMQTRIVEASRRFFIRQGHRKTSVFEIASEVGCSPGNLYRIFSGTKAIALAVGERLLSLVRRGVDEVLPENGSAEARIRSQLTGEVESFAAQLIADPGFVPITAIVARTHSEDFVRERHADWRRDGLIRELGRGAASGELDAPDPKPRPTRS